MGAGRYRLFMKLDALTKTSVHPAEKSRAMSVISKIGIIYRFRRIITGLAVVSLFAYLFFRGMHRVPGLDLTVVIIVYGIILAIAFLFIFSGVRRLMRLIVIIEYGTTTTAAVSGFKEWTLKSRLWAGPGTIGHAVFRTTHKRGCIICRYNDSSGKSHTLQFFFHNDGDQIKKGDQFQVLYDPGMPGNAIAVDALPRFVKTTPAL